MYFWLQSKTSFKSCSDFASQYNLKRGSVPENLNNNQKLLSILNFIPSMFETLLIPVSYTHLTLPTICSV